MINDKIDLNKFFIANRSCVINADLDGVLSGMILQKYLNWKIVGFSMCNGTVQDNLYVADLNYNLQEFVFVDLYVADNKILSIDQHMIAINDKHLDNLIKDNVTLNPNIIRKRMLFSDDFQNGYIFKYPFGTVHYILSCLEKLNVINDNWTINNILTKDKFDSIDLFLRADRVVGNFLSYNRNCNEWAKWLINESGNTAKFSRIFFEDLINNIEPRLTRQRLVEQKLKMLNCTRGDGEFSDLLQFVNKEKLDLFLSWLSDITNLPKLDLPHIFYKYNKLTGWRINVTNFKNSDDVLNLINNISGLFSMAIVSSKEISVTVKK